MNVCSILIAAFFAASLFAADNSPTLPPIDEDVPYFADDTVKPNLARYGKKMDTLSLPKNRDTAVESMAPPPSRFAGSLYVHTDNGDTLPVFINGKKAGVTPYRAAHFKVGRYKISYMDSLLRDTLANGLGKSDRGVPAGYAFLFRGRSVGAALAQKSLAAYAEQTVVVRNDEESEVIFAVQDMLSTTEATKKTYYGQIILGGAIITGIALVLLISAD